MTGTKGGRRKEGGLFLDGWKLRGKGEKKDEVGKKKGVKGNGTVGAEEKR